MTAGLRERLGVALRASRPRGAARACTIAAWLAALALAAARARAQDFEPAAPAASASARSPAAALERGLPAADGAAALECAATSWHGLPDLVTRDLALGGGWRALRLAAGVSQTGDPELGWEAAGLALGVAGARGGAAVRGLARRDRTPGERLSRLGAGVGVEAGAGAWLDASAAVRVWASAPQVWCAGVPPPLARPLEIGAALTGGGARAWLARDAPISSDPGGGESVGGVALALGSAEAWVEARDAPLRGTLGLAVQVRALEVSASVEGHPVLGEAVRLDLTVRAGGER